MILTQTETKVVSKLCGANIAASCPEAHDGDACTCTNADSACNTPAGTFRTFHGVEHGVFDDIYTAEQVVFGNAEVRRLPNTEAVHEFLADYPFFSLNGFLHNLSVTDPLEVYITSIEFVPSGCIETDPMAHLAEEDLHTLKRRFTETFYKADDIALNPHELVADYHFDRTVEAPMPTP